MFTSRHDRPRIGGNRDTSNGVGVADGDILAPRPPVMRALASIVRSMIDIVAGRTRTRGIMTAHGSA